MDIQQHVDCVAGHLERAAKDMKGAEDGLVFLDPATRTEELTAIIRGYTGLIERTILTLTVNTLGEVAAIIEEHIPSLGGVPLDVKLGINTAILTLLDRVRVVREKLLTFTSAREAVGTEEKTTSPLN